MFPISGRLLDSYTLNEAADEATENEDGEEEEGDDQVTGTVDTKMSYSGFKMLDVKRSLVSAMHAGKLEPACYWSAEMVCSGQLLAIWELVILYYAKHIHLANPALAIYLNYRWTQFHGNIRASVAHDDWCNDTTIRRLVCELVCMICISKKSHTITFPRVKVSSMFDDERYRADHSRYSDPFIGDGDPPELGIPVNELAYQLTQVVSHLAEASYWIEWLITYVTIAKRNKRPITIAVRPFVPPTVDRRLHNHPIWIIWDVMLHETRQRQDALLLQYMTALLHLFCVQLTVGGIAKKRPVVHMAATMLTQPFVRIKHIMPDDIAVSLAMDNISVIYRQIKHA
jgi:hypothetical protein